MPCLQMNFEVNVEKSKLKELISELEKEIAKKHGENWLTRNPDGIADNYIEFAVELEGTIRPNSQSDQVFKTEEQVILALNSFRKDNELSDEQVGQKRKRKKNSSSSYEKNDQDRSEEIENPSSKRKVTDLNSMNFDQFKARLKQYISNFVRDCRTTILANLNDSLKDVYIYKFKNIAAPLADQAKLIFKENRHKPEDIYNKYKYNQDIVAAKIFELINNDHPGKLILNSKKLEKYAEVNNKEINWDMPNNPIKALDTQSSDSLSVNQSNDDDQITIEKIQAHGDGILSSLSTLLSQLNLEEHKINEFKMECEKRYNEDKAERRKIVIDKNQTQVREIIALLKKNYVSFIINKLLALKSELAYKSSSNQVDSAKAIDSLIELFELHSLKFHHNKAILLKSDAESKRQEADDNMEVQADEQHPSNEKTSVAIEKTISGDKLADSNPESETSQKLIIEETSSSLESYMALSLNFIEQFFALPDYIRKNFARLNEIFENALTKFEQELGLVKNKISIIVSENKSSPNLKYKYEQEHIEEIYEAALIKLNASENRVEFEFTPELPEVNIASLIGENSLDAIFNEVNNGKEIFC